MCCQKRFEAGVQAPAHPVSDRNVSGQLAKGMRGHQSSPVDASISESATRSDAYPDADSGARGGPGELWLQETARAAASRGMEGQPQARLSDLPGRRAGGSDQEAAETGQRPVGMATIPDREGVNFRLDQGWGEAQMERLSNRKWRELLGRYIFGTKEAE